MRWRRGLFYSWNNWNGFRRAGREGRGHCRVRKSGQSSVSENKGCLEIGCPKHCRSEEGMKKEEVEGN